MTTIGTLPEALQYVRSMFSGKYDIHHLIGSDCNTVRITIIYIP